MAESGKSKSKKVLLFLQARALKKADRNLSYDIIRLAFRTETDLKDDDKIREEVMDMIRNDYLIAIKQASDPIGATLDNRLYQIGEEGLILMSENQERI